MTEKKEKSLSITKIYFLLLILIFGGILILVFSGTFDKPSSVNFQAQQQNNQQTDPHGGVDMSQLQKINELEKKYESNPDDLNTLESLAHLLNDSGFYNKAIEKYKIYLEKNPENADIRVDMGVCYYELKQNAQAIKVMKEALNYQPAHQIAHMNIGVVYFADNNRPEAINWWKKAVELNPSSEIGIRSQQLIDSNQ